MAELELSIALERYDRHMPFFLGTVKAPDGVRLKPLEVGMVLPGRDGLDRHGRMFHQKEFDICELSLGSYIMAKARGAALTATPVFPRRLFSQNHIYINAAAGIDGPRDLIGKRVGIRAFQVTMSVLAKGDLKSEYGVPWQDIDWFVQVEEELPWTGDGVSIARIPPDKDAGEMLIAGELDALILPHPPHWLFADNDHVRRLFPDTRAECIRHFQKHGFYPIMHLMAFHQELVDREPWLPSAMMEMWEDAKRQTQDIYTDPGYSLLALARNELDAQTDYLSPDPWPSGVVANRADLERFIGFCVDQKLIDQPIPVDDLFHESVRDS